MCSGDMTKGRNPQAHEDARDSSRRIRLPSRRDSQLGRSLRRAYNGATDSAMPDEFADLLAQLA